MSELIDRADGPRPSDDARRPPTDRVRPDARPSGGRRLVRPRSTWSAHRAPAARSWIDAPWPTERIVRYLTALVVVGGARSPSLQVVHPDLVFTNNTPTGGDMGAHVMGPAYLRDHLLPQRPAQRLEQLLVRRLPDVPLLHGHPGADDRRAQRRASRTASPSRSSPSSASSRCRSAAGRSAGWPGSATRCPS